MSKKWDVDTLKTCAGISRSGSIQLGVLVSVQGQAKGAGPRPKSPRHTAAGHCDAPGQREPEVQQQILAGRPGKPRVRQSLTKHTPLSGGPTKPPLVLPERQSASTQSASSWTMASSPPEMQLQRMGTALVFVQPLEEGKASGASVMIELQSGVPVTCPQMAPQTPPRPCISPARAFLFYK